MKLVLSPAKSLDFETALPTEKFTEAQFLDKIKKVSQIASELDLTMTSSHNF